MGRTWTYGQKLALGFTLVSLLTVIISAIAITTLNRVVAAKDQVIAVEASLMEEGQRLYYLATDAALSARDYITTGDRRYIDANKRKRQQIWNQLNKLREISRSEEGKSMLDAIVAAERARQAATDRVFSRMEGNSIGDAAIRRMIERELLSARESVFEDLANYIKYVEGHLDERVQASTRTAERAVTFLILAAVATVLTAAIIGWLLARTLYRQLGSAIQHIQSSSAELQAAATQQATGSNQQSAAVNEIATTIRQLLSTSRQIADSSRQVAQIADETLGAARSGDGLVRQGQDTVSTTKRQMDVVVSHMVDLGKRSQQIGGVVEVINELTEQTNILAINATIEAAGAGESGQRFSVVADEIRKLADRVGTSTKDIRALIDEIRTAINTAIMATESGSKVVDASARQFGEVAQAFGQIASSIATTNDAARQIELSTKQQSSAVEQVNQAVSNVAQAVREMEASSTQTLQTASQLAGLSRELGTLLHMQKGA